MHLEKIPLLLKKKVQTENMVIDWFYEMSVAIVLKGDLWK